MTDTDPILYIIMRNDLSSLNPGKACAQFNINTYEEDHMYELHKNLPENHR